MWRVLFAAGGVIGRIPSAGAAGEPNLTDASRSACRQIVPKGGSRQAWPTELVAIVPTKADSQSHRGDQILGGRDLMEHPDPDAPAAERSEGSRAGCASR